MLGRIVLFHREYNPGLSDVKIDGSALDEMLSFETLGLRFSFKLDLCPYITCFPKIYLKELEPRLVV